MSWPAGGAGPTDPRARAVFFSALARLQRDNLIMLARFKTNLDYDRELGRRTRHLPHVRPAFRWLVQTFERCWYGVTAPDETTVARARALLSEMDAHA